jgi:hypothetical protein
MERQIGEVFKHKKSELITVICSDNENPDCENCAFDYNHLFTSDCSDQICTKQKRSDNRDVWFKLVK